MTPQLPEDLRVEYTFGYANQTPNGRRLPQPHPAVEAALYPKAYTGALPIAKGIAVTKSGPAVGERPGCSCSFDHFDAERGKQIALGRALKQLA